MKINIKLADVNISREAMRLNAFWASAFVILSAIGSVVGAIGICFCCAYEDAARAFVIAAIYACSAEVLAQNSILINSLLSDNSQDDNTETK